MPSEAELAESGLSRADYEERVDVWPDNEISWSVFVQLSSQWRVGMSGPTGLDYTPIPFVLEVNGIPRDQWRAVFDDVRAMEKAAVKEMHTEE